LSEAVAQQVVSASALAVQVKESNERQERDRNVLRILTGLIVFKLITLIVLVFVIIGMNHANAAIKDCTTPAGQCAKRGAASTGLFLSSSALRGERERLHTEVPIAEAKGDTQGAQMRRARLADLDQQIAKVDQQLADIRSGKTKL
jgi:hypothetical protein